MSKKNRRRKIVSKSKNSSLKKTIIRGRKLASKQSQSTNSSFSSLYSRTAETGLKTMNYISIVGEKKGANACNHYDIPEDTTLSWYQRIRSKLSDTQRVYHNWSCMLAPKRPELERAQPHIVLAAFFQYYEFDLSKSSVEENCKMFKEFCCDAMLEDEDMKQNVCLLLGQKSTEAISSDIYDDMAKLQDLDLLILASSADAYKTYADLSRQEWLNSGKTNYEDLRRKTLGALLALDIYQTTDFNAKYAKAARSNIEQELKELEQC